MKYLTCTVCSGSGEGRYEGTRCWACKGSGVEPEEDDECLDATPADPDEAPLPPCSGITKQPDTASHVTAEVTISRTVQGLLAAHAHLFARSIKQGEREPVIPILKNWSSN